MKKRTLVLAYTVMAVGLTLTACNTDTEVEETTEIATEVTTEEEISSKKTTETDGKKTTTEESSKEVTEQVAEEKTTNTSSNKSTTTQTTTQTSTQSTTTQTTTQSNTQSSTTQTTASTPATTHEHEWQPVYKTVHHDAVTHVETKTEVIELTEDLNTPATPGDARYPIQEDHNICNGCGYDYTAHGLSPGLSCPSCGGGGFHDQMVTVRWHVFREVTTPTTVVDKEAYDEQVLDHYECSKCGATK